MSPAGRRATIVITMLLAALLATAAAIGATTPTQAGWTDRSMTGAATTAGTWPSAAAPGCSAMTSDGRPRPDGTCVVTAVRYDEWGEPGSRTRNYYVTMDSNAGAGFIRFTVDLSAGEGSGSDFGWTTANLVPGGQASPVLGWTCSQLPMLTADTPTGWGWGVGSTIYFQVAENGSAGSADESPTC
ncbi:hypothetical protein [uncultured Aeromicrobium sp.]|uniref:hypothetical protein n=1 Tax=uncultured Aeromicrobium sp. TaxID=337820 RepID=UPI0025E3240E|nr:hypothetical protein [uncultured Aeromicrobium sp.]